MKRIVKGVFLFILVILSLTIVYPTNANALSQQTPYININDDTKNLTLDNLLFSNIAFKDYSSSSVQAFGISGVVINNLDRDLNYTFLVRYFDFNYKFIAQQQVSSTINIGSNVFNILSNLDILKRNYANINDIVYYKLYVFENSEDQSQNIIKPSQNNQYNSYDYVIDKYDVNIDVNENNTLDITETITAFFNVAKHGIYRTIPLKNTITRLDGTTSKNRTQITNLSVDNEYTTSKEDGNYKIQIGSENRTLTGEQTYVIKYTYNLGKDPMKDYDELYYNIIGSDWDTVIGNVTFTISMPKEFDSSKLGFSSGKTGSTNNGKIKYNVSGNKITGSYDGILDIADALTVRCELDEGYFVGAGLTTSFTTYLMFIIPILFLIIFILIWHKYGRDDKVIETVEFYPPEGLNSLEVGFLYKGKADEKDVISLLIYLANKGYIKITETEEKNSLSKSKSFKITKLKEYDGTNKNEQLFMDGLFKNQNETVKSTALKNHFYITLDRILDNTNNEKNKNIIFEKSTLTRTIVLILLIIISVIVTISIPTIDYGGRESLVLMLILCAFYIPFYAVGLFSKTPLPFRIFWLGFTIFHSALFFSTLPIIDAIKTEQIYLFGFIVGLSCVIGMIIYFKLMPKRNKYGTEILGKLKGFKNFLETAEKEKLEALVNEEPTYFYDILPYTYVLGVSDKWIKNFEIISLQAPSWYDSSNTFNMITFSSFMDSTMTSAQNVMSSKPSSSGGGSSGGSFSSGSSGGGSSGGGSGGGGGGSW